MRTLVVWLVGLAICCLAGTSFGGGSGYNVVVVVNQNSTNSVQLGNYYRAQRQVPPQNFLRISYPVGNAEWPLTDFTNALLNPLLAMLANRQLTNQIDYIVLSMDIPYRVNGGAYGENSTTSSLFYGFKPDTRSVNICPIAPGSANLYAGSEGIFRSTPPGDANSNSWMVTMLASSNNLALAEMVVNQGVISDGAFPSQTVWLAKGLQLGYNDRYPAFDNAIFNTRLRGNYSVNRTNSQDIWSGTPLLGVLDGAYTVSLTASPPALFVPGAMADNLNSFGGQFLESIAGQTSLLVFLAAGASGSYGTVIEPCAYQAKFPDPQNYLYQARGFSLGECYYQSLTNPYEGVVVGEPLAAPFALPATGAWKSLASNTVLGGITNLSVQFSAPDDTHPVQQVDLFLDGHWLQTVTNIPPRTGDLLKVSINGFVTSYIVPPGATIKSVASNLVNALNGPAYSASTKVSASLHGDRIELHSTAPYTATGAQIPISAFSSTISGPLNTYIHTAAGSPTTFLDSVAQGIKGYKLSGTVGTNATLSLTVTKTSGAVASISVTNTVTNSNPMQLAQLLVTAINSNPSLQSTDGLVAGDLQSDGSGNALFNLLAQSQGYAAAQITVTLTVSTNLVISPAGANALTDNTSDLTPRTHLYITAGLPNLAVSVPFITTNQPDGYHELAAVAYEGSHVHTQARATQNIIIKNTSLTATFNAVLSGTNSALQPTLNFNVNANAASIATIQLFSTGGMLAAVTNQSTAAFSITLSNLDVGLHPFYAIVTDNSGHQYRTPTQTIGLIGVSFGGSTLFGVDLPFTLQVSGPAPTLVWPATAGRTYTVFSSTNFSGPFLVKATVTPTTSLGQFIETNAAPMQQFYRVSVIP